MSICCFFLSAFSRVFRKKDIYNQKAYQTFLFSAKTISFEKANCVDIDTNMYGHCYMHRTILNKSCVIYFCYYHHSIIYEFVVISFHTNIKKMMRNDKTLFVKLSCNINVGTCGIYPLYNSIDKHEKSFFSHSPIGLFIYFIFFKCHLSFL